jgi:hypothetical protein
MHKYTEVALSAINTDGVGGTAFTSAAKPKSKDTAHASVMRLGFSIVERARVR